MAEAQTPYLTVAQTAARLNRSVGTVYNMIKDGHLKLHPVPYTKRNRLKRDEVEVVAVELEKLDLQEVKSN